MPVYLGRFSYSADAMKALLGEPQDRSAAAREVADRFKEGTAAGNYGDFYDNHDDDHSTLRYDQFLQLTRIEFDRAAKQRDLHRGLQTRFFYNGITFGNASMSNVGGPYWRSMPA